jgi:uncharacterized membrane protein YjgN (DUF898 family)
VNTLSDGSAYATGWFVNQSRAEVYHGGSNPNFSSGIVLKPNEKIGVAVLANMDSDFTQRIAFGIQNILYGNEPAQNLNDTYTSIDKLASTAVIVVIPFLLVIGVLLIKSIAQIIKGKRILNFNGAKSIIGYGLSSVLILAIEYFLYRIPQILNNGVTWRTARVFGPNTVFIAVLEIGILTV